MIKSRCTSQFHWLGLQDYKALETRQKNLVPEILGQKQILVFGAEFYPVLTLGVRGRLSEDLKCTPEKLQHQGLEIVKTDRGGQATIHSPGQLVIYPMLDLNVHGLGVQDFVKYLMRATLGAFAELEIRATFNPVDPGIYTSHGKIGFCGLRSDRGVIRHGLSINIENDLSLFDGIRSCGHSQPQLDQVGRYKKISTSEFFFLWQKYFEKEMSSHFELLPSGFLRGLEVEI